MTINPSYDDKFEMMRKQKVLTHLFEVLEQATEGSRELDAQIQAYQFGGTVHEKSDGGLLIVVNGIQHGIAWTAVPHYSTSLDAALTLVPEGCSPSDIVWGLDEVSAYLAWPMEPYAKQVRGDGATAELALCIAAIRAEGEKP